MPLGILFRQIIKKRVGLKYLKQLLENVMDEALFIGLTLFFNIMNEMFMNENDVFLLLYSLK
ncbi:Uncharacterised protein [Mycobacteroides abscessus subsp. abscessus]|nr:Uncharacterised protein [Mycobacteroides abscessus subsp. abscessus]